MASPKITLENWITEPQITTRMADLRRSVYERFENPGRSRNPTQEIQGRVAAFKAVLAASRELSEEPEFPEGLVRHWVTADVTAFRKIVIEEERQAVAADIAVSMQNAAYAKQLKATDARLARRAVESAMLTETPLGAVRVADSSPDAAVTSRVRPDVPSNLPPPAANTKKPAKAPSPSANGFAGSVPIPVAAPKLLDPQGDVKNLLAAVTYKTQGDGTVKYSVRDKFAFVDHGNQILMVAKAHEDDDAILAGLLLASEKYGGSFEITGTEEFKRRAIELLVKYQLTPTLKNAAQDALFRELSKQATPPPPSDAYSDSGTQSGPTGGQTPEPPAQAVAHTNPAAAAKSSNPIPVKALDWWTTQRDLIQSSGQAPADTEESLRQLGPKPSRNTTWWFRDGKPCPPPPTASSSSSKSRHGFAGGVGDYSSNHKAAKEEAAQPAKPSGTRRERKSAARPNA